MKLYTVFFITYWWVHLRGFKGFLQRILYFMPTIFILEKQNRISVQKVIEFFAFAVLGG